MARPVWTPTDPQRRQAETMAAYGIPEADIARVLGVSKPTLRKHCGTELDTGGTRANSKVADFLFYGICGGTGKPAFKDERARVARAVRRGGRQSAPLEAFRSARHQDHMVYPRPLDRDISRRDESRRGRGARDRHPRLFAR